MERPYPAIEFECELSPGGSIILPPQIARHFGPGRRVTVRITGGVVSGGLRARGVTENAIQAMSELQLEARENVIDFLQAESSLAGSAAFRKRAAGLIRRKH